jgi:hypothetical protein
MKYCPKCKTEKELNKFNKHKSRPDGLQAYCILCSARNHWEYVNKYRDVHNINRRKYRDENLEKAREESKRKRESLKQRYNHVKGKAKKRNIDFNISFDDIKDIPMVCYYTGIGLTLESNKLNTISFERVDNNICYNKSNVVFCCTFVNRMKNNKTMEEFLFYCEKILENKERLLTKR